jgi:sulfite reductase (NADPH) flavoprotein alpha-component
MQTMSNIPFIPSSAPFTPEQRAWLNGYFVGLLSTAHGSDSSSQPTPAEKNLLPLLIGFGSQTGTAEQLAKRISKESSQHGFIAEVRELNSITLENLAQRSHFIIVTSTWGDGDSPDNAAEFWKSLSADPAPKLENLNYSVLALGDRNYSDFCGAGKKFDERLAALSAKRLHPRADCDVDYEAIANKWLTSLWPALVANSGEGERPREPLHPVTTHSAETIPTTAPQFSRTNPFPARLLTNRLLNTPGSAKETRHIEISLAGSGLTYEVGDALGVLPRNCADLASELLTLGGWSESTTVTTSDGHTLPLEEALLTKCDLRKPTSALVDAVAKTEGCERLVDLLTPEKNSLKEYLAQREVIDLLCEFPAFRPDAAEFVKLLSKLQPRLYSISSSLRAFPDQVHLTVGVVRYETCGRKRKGLCSTFLADRVQTGGAVPVFVQPSHGFKLPRDPATPIIMVGPGTGIAPFRAFLHERKITAAPGKNWLFFGDQQAACDFLYRDELETFKSSGLLTRLDLAFSRDQTEKIYVQNRMLESAAELFRWLEDGAHFYVCGDAKRMAKDVDAALHKVIELSGLSPEAAAEYVQKLKTEKRYQRDVY